MVTAGTIRVGIDVGGTFTHAVAIDGLTLELAGKVKVPTSHTAPEGVAKGIIDSLRLLLDQSAIAPGNVGFIAHSTTQATNALLEGDVAQVGILGMGGGSGRHLASMATNIGKIKLSPGKYLNTFHQFIDSTRQPADNEIKRALDKLLEKGAKAIAISEAFSVDNTDNECKALAIARDMGLLATAGSEVSQLYGLKVRTRTAVLNASMLPKMIESADMTERSVRDAGITAPVMIMRSDGGVMDIESMRKRPILTILSGPAAGVAAAMMYLHISDGIFMEIGGTSTDISAIRNGRALVKTAEIGGHKVYLRTLDVRTVGIAGGSMLRMSGKDLLDVGPRSAHIAGLSYVSFAEPMKDPQVCALQPHADDPVDYIALCENGNQPSLCLTPTCAANLLDLVPENDCAKGNKASVQKGFEAASGNAKNATDLARSVLTKSTDKCWPVVKQLMSDYKLDGDLTTLVGGGGGAAALVPFLGQREKLPHRLAKNADVISAIGVALALLRETVERQITNPDSEAILRVRQEAAAAVQRMGANPSTIEVQVEVDNKTNVVRATAFGATSLTQKSEALKPLSAEERLHMVASSLHVPAESVHIACQTEHFQVYQAQTIAKHLGGLIQHKCLSLRIVDEKGVVRLQAKNGAVKKAKASEAEAALAAITEEHAEYGDAGRIIPPVLMLAGAKIVDLSGLLDLAQIVAVAKIELESLPRDTEIIVIALLQA